MSRLCTLLILSLVSSGAQALDPILEKFEQRYLGWKDVCATLNTVVTLRNGRSETGQSRTCLLSSEDDTGYLRVSVKLPEGARNTEIVSKLERDGQRRQWLYMPIKKEPIQVDDRRMELAFMGTDFSYVDFAINLVDAEELKPVETGDCGGKPCTAFDLKPRPGEYQRRVWLITDTGALHHVTIHNKDFHVKTMEVLHEQPHGSGYWLADKVKMSDHRSNSHTVVTWNDIQFDGGLTPAYFDPDVIYPLADDPEPEKKYYH